MDADTERVRAAYDRDPEREWRRLESGAQYRLEHLVNMHALRRHLPPAAGQPRILDAGGGPGRYAIGLAAAGYRVTLADLSPALLALARRRIAAAGATVQANVEMIAEASITDLSQWPDGVFDAVLCLGGPLSHETEEKAREHAVGELRRVAHPGAPVFLGALNRLGAYRSVVQWPDCWDQFFPRFLTGSTIPIGPGAPAYHFMPEELLGLLRRMELTLDQLYGCSGIGAHLQEECLQALMADPVRWETWRGLLLATCDHPNVVGVSYHLLAVARR